MIDLHLIRQWGTAVLALVFFALWQLAEWHETQALRIAAATVETNGACIASYRESERRIGQAVHNLTTALQTQ